MNSVRWTFNKQGLIQQLEDFGVSNVATYVLHGGVQVGYWGAIISLKNLQTNEEISVKYIQEEIDRSPALCDEFKTWHNLQVQEYFLKELAREMQAFIRDHYNYQVSVVDNINQ